MATFDAYPVANFWESTGNAGTVATAYSNTAAQTGNFLGTLDNQAVEIYTNASSINAKTDLALLTATPTAAGITAPVDILRVRRNGQNGVTPPQALAIGFGHWFADANARTRADIKLSNLAVNSPDATVMSLFSQGSVVIGGIGGSIANYGYNTATGGVGKNAIAGALFSLTGANGSLNGGPHTSVTTASDNFPLSFHLNWAHDDVGYAFDAYYDGAWKASHTTRPYALYKINGKLNIYGSSAVPAAAGNVWTPDLIASFRHAGTTLGSGELFFENITKSRRIVLYDNVAAPGNDHQFYGIGLTGGAFRFQIDSIAQAYRFFAATGAAASNEIMSLIGNGRLGLGIINPNAQLHVSGPNVNANAGAPLFRLADTNIAASYFAVDNGAAANAYRLISSVNLELQSAGISNQVMLSTNGGVGIGTNAPTAGSGNLSVATGAFKPGGGAWGAFSDRRLKRNIKDAAYGLPELLKLRPVTFQYNGEGSTLDDGRTHYGLIAQDVQAILPEFVDQDEAGWLMLPEGISRFDAMMIRAIQELTNRLVSVEAICKTQKSTQSQLRKRN